MSSASESSDRIDGSNDGSVDDAFQLSIMATNMVTNFKNEFGWVAAAKTSASDAAARVFNCATDTAVIEDEEFFGNDQPLPPTLPRINHGADRRSSKRHLPDDTSNETKVEPDLERATTRADSSDVMSTLTTPVSDYPPPSFGTTETATMKADPSEPASDYLPPSLGTTTWDDLYEQKIPDQNADQNIILNSERSGSKKPGHATDRKKKHRIILGAAVLLSAVLVAVGIVLQQTYKTSSSSEQNDNYSNAEGSLSGDNKGTQSRSPIMSPTHAPTKGRGTTTNENMGDENQQTSVFNGSPTLVLQPSPPVNVPVTAAPLTQAATIASTITTSSENEPSPSISWEELFPDEDLTTSPPITASPMFGQISPPTSLAPSVANKESPMSPSSHPSTANPTSLAPTIRPSLRPSRAKPTKSPSTESPTADQPTTLGPTVATPKPTRSTVSPTTAQPTSLAPTTGQPTSLAPTVVTTEPSPSPTSLALMTADEESIILNPSPTSLAPTTGRPTSLAATTEPTPWPTSLALMTVGDTPEPIPSPTSLAPTVVTTEPTPSPTNLALMTVDGESTNNINSSGPTESRLNIELQTDKHGQETSWTLYSVNVETDGQTTLITSVEENTYEPFEQDSVELFLTPGKYRFTLKDAYGDGFCCSNGSDGSYVISVDGRELIRGGYYMDEISYDIIIGYNSEMSDRDTQWLEAHNSRRKTWHESHDKTYVPLLWSKELAEDASSWAQELLNDCGIPGITHESGVSEGENLSKNTATTEDGMGQLYPADNILRRWVDREETWGYPRNAHLTQVLWRASRYLGCGDAVRNYDDGSICRVQVCRYVRAGNCVMGSFDASEGDNWLVPMLMDQTACGPDCPAQGCF